LRIIGALVLILVGSGFVLFRHSCSKTLFSFVHTFGPFKNRERVILKSLRVASLVWGGVLVVLGILMSMGIVFS
jgi:hypothetical protein